MKLVPVIVLAAVLFTSASSVRAQTHRETPERVSLELHLGPYEPDGNRAAFDQFFRGDRGPLGELQAFFHVYRIPYVGPLGVVATGGWARYKGRACSDPACGDRSEESVIFHVFPVSAMAALRFDALWHEWHVPLFLQGGIGLEWTRFRSTKGGERDGYGSAFGLRWQAQIGLYLDAFERRAARALDVEHGINHTYVFFELRGSTASADVPVADRFTWTGGLGLTF